MRIIVRPSASARRARQSGYVGYVIGLVILLILVGSAISRGGGQSVEIQRLDDTARLIASQASMIRQKVLTCDMVKGASPTDNAGNPVAAGNVRDLRCGSTTTYLFDPADNAFLPPPPNGWGEWQWSQAGNVSKISITRTTSATALPKVVAEKVNRQFTSGETRCAYVDGTSVTVTLWLKYQNLGDPNAPPSSTNFPSCD